MGAEGAAAAEDGAHLGAPWTSARWTSAVDVGVKADEHVLQRLRAAEAEETAAAAAAAAAAVVAAAAGSSSSDGGVGGGEDMELERAGERMLREHFEQLTLSFLQPLETFT